MRPYPPARLCDVSNYIIEFLPAPEIVEWLKATFFAKSSPLFNPEHDHLEYATIGALYTNAENVRHQMRIVGTAELGRPPNTLTKWARARWVYQVEHWFGEAPDFILTFYAPYLATADDLSFCSTVEHEVLHCGQAKDEYGNPVFYKSTGLPKYALKGHDVEEHVSIVRRYGAVAGAGNTLEMAEAASRPPEIGLAMARGACGNCAAAAA